MNVYNNMYEYLNVYIILKQLIDLRFLDFIEMLETNIIYLSLLKMSQRFIFN